MTAILDVLRAGFLAASTAQSPVTHHQQPPAPVPVTPRDRVEVTDARQTIRARLAELTSDSVVLESQHGRITLPLATVQSINRVGDSLANGTAIGAAIGGGSALALMAKVCSNSNCADTSENLDPRFTLLGTLIGAGVGALIDGAFESRKPVYRAGAGQLLPTQSTPIASQNDVMLFGRLGWARVTDDEGSLGSGATVGAGVIVPIGSRIGLQVAYDRHTRTREFEFSGGFFGTEQLLTAKALFFFRSTEAIRPYAGLGLGLLDSTRRSEFPTFTSRPGGRPIAGPPEIFRYHTRGAALGFATGVDARVVSRLSVLGDLTLDLGSPAALGSTRLTVGAGWRF